MNWRGPAFMALSAVLVLIAMTANLIPLGGVIVHPFLGVMLAVCAWFAYWGAVGALIGYAIPVFLGVPLLPALESVAVTVIALAVFISMLRARWIDIEARRLASLIGLTQVIVSAVLVRQFFVFGIFTLPALFRYPTVGPVLWNFVVSFAELGVTTLFVALPLLHFATPLIKQVQRE